MVSKIGEGGFASTFLVNQISQQTPCVLKLQKKPIDDEDAIMREFRIHSKLTHNNVVKLLKILDVEMLKEDWSKY